MKQPVRPDPAYNVVTVNPAMGNVCDLLTAQGGTGVLAETPEIYGAEHLLIRRAATSEVGENPIGLIHWWEVYTIRNKGSMARNPSPGNKKGGLTSILEKPLGAAVIGRTKPLNGGCKYAEPVTGCGFNFMDSPGFDSASVTGQIASGEQSLRSPRGAVRHLGRNPHQRSRLPQIPRYLIA